MGLPTQYGKATDLSLPARLKLVGTMRGRGWSANRIARELHYDVRTAKKDIATVIDRYREFEDVDVHLKDVSARLGEQLTKLNEQEAILWKQLDWAREWVIQKDGFNQPIYESVHDDEEGAIQAPTPLMGPRRPGIVLQTISSLMAIQKEQNTLLGLLNKNVDISVTLQKTEMVQVRIMEVLKDADPDTYKKIVRVLKAAESTFDVPAIPQRIVSRELVEGEYEDARS